VQFILAVPRVHVLLQIELITKLGKLPSCRRLAKKFTAITSTRCSPIKTKHCQSDNDYSACVSKPSLESIVLSVDGAINDEEHSSGLTDIHV